MRTVPILKALLVLCPALCLAYSGPPVELSKENFSQRSPPGSRFTVTESNGLAHFSFMIRIQDVRRFNHSHAGLLLSGSSDIHGYIPLRIELTRDKAAGHELFLIQFDLSHFLARHGKLILHIPYAASDGSLIPSLDMYHFSLASFVDDEAR